MTYKMATSVVVGVVLATPVLTAGTSEAKANCGQIHGKVGTTSLTLTVYRIKGSVSCTNAKRYSRHVLGARCQGETLVAGYRCYHGAAVLHEPAASGVTLRKSGEEIELRVRAA